MLRTYPPSLKLEGDVGESGMDEGQIIFVFLFPTRKQSAGTTGPAVRDFDDPTTSLAPFSAGPLLFAA